MALEENVATRLSYKVHTATSMTPNTLLVPGTDPGASGGQELRRVGSTLRITRPNYRSNEIRTSRQRSDMRLGISRVEGEITGELSPDTYFDLYEAAFRATKVATFNKSNSDFTSVAADNTTSKFTVAASTWAAQGFRVGDVISFANLSDADNNSKNFLIYSLSTVDAFVTPAPDTMGADSAFTVTRVGTKITIPTSSHVKRLFAFEHYYGTADLCDLFTENRITGASWQIPATGMVTTTIPVMGRAVTRTSAGSAPFFTSPTAAGTDGIVAGVNGKVVAGGSVVGTITGINFGINNNPSVAEVLGQNFVAECFLGPSDVTGSVSIFFDSATFMNALDAETVLEFYIMLTTTSAANSPFVAFAMTNVKLTGVDLPLQGEGGLVQNCPFTALEKGTATGYDATTICHIDSVAT